MKLPLQFHKNIRKQDRSWRFRYIQSFDLILIRYVFLIILTNYFSLNGLNTIKFNCYGSELIEINTLLAQFRKCKFSYQNVDFLLNAVCSITGSYQLILLIFISKHWTTPDYFLFKFEQNWSKIATVRVPQRKNAK